jgi:hypothetical protein
MSVHTDKSTGPRELKDMPADWGMSRSMGNTPWAQKFKFQLNDWSGA